MEAIGFEVKTGSSIRTNSSRRTSPIVHDDLPCSSIPKDYTGHSIPLSPASMAEMWLLKDIRYGHSGMLCNHAT